MSVLTFLFGMDLGLSAGMAASTVGKWQRRSRTGSRIRLLIDVETDDIEQLQRYVADQPAVKLRFNPGYPVGATMFGRFVGAKEAHDAVAEVAVAPDPKAL